MQKVKNFFVKIKNFFVKVFLNVKSWFETDDSFLSYKEQKEIAKSNRRVTRQFEKDKKRKKPESAFVTEMKNPENIVEFEDLKTYFYTDMGVVKSVDGVTFSIPKNSTVGVVGESGCGKSVTSLSLMRLVQGPQGQIVDGSIRFKTTVPKMENGKPVPIYTEEKNEKGEPVQAVDHSGFFAFETEEKTYDIAKMPMNEMHRIRGKEIAMIFQEPMTSLNPVFTVGYQLDEVVLLHEQGATKASAKIRSIEMLNAVGIAMAEKVYKQYPHELSGGMRQRVMIAMAIICDPKLIVADEPTTALDVTIQAQILDLFREVKQKISGSIMLITHDLGVIAEMADYVVIMYAGRIIEKGTVKEIFAHPKHPYTVGLQKSKPVLNKETEMLYNIPGQVPSPINIPDGCYFKDRCEKCHEQCQSNYPPEIIISPTHSVSCHLYKNFKEEEGEKAKVETKKKAKGGKKIG